MGFVDKFKDLFTDVIEEEEQEMPIKKEVMHVEINPPKGEEKEKEKLVEEPTIEKEILKDIPKKEKVWFDDEDFDILPKPDKKEPVKKVESTYMLKKDKKETKKNFAPSPIISPVYGVLDKNYIKEDVRDKKSSKSLYDTNTELSIDAIRKKAFGTLEDELELDLYAPKHKTREEKYSETKEEEPKKDIFDELDFNLDGVLDDEEDKIKLDYIAHIPKKDDKPLLDELTDDEEENKSEDDLFDLIGSVYDKEED